MSNVVVDTYEAALGQLFITLPDGSVEPVAMLADIGLKTTKSTKPLSDGYSAFDLGEVVTKRKVTLSAKVKSYSAAKFAALVDGAVTSGGDFIVRETHDAAASITITATVSKFLGVLNGTKLMKKVSGAPAAAGEYSVSGQTLTCHASETGTLVVIVATNDATAKTVTVSQSEAGVAAASCGLDLYGANGTLRAANCVVGNVSWDPKAEDVAEMSIEATLYPAADGKVFQKVTKV